MRDYLHNEYATSASLARRLPTAEVAPIPLSRRRRAMAAARALSSFMLATLLSVLIVAADRLVDVWSGGHLLLAVLVLWLVLFTGLALFARWSRRLALRMTTGLQAWAARTALDRSDAAVLHLARQDPRVVADVNATLSRGAQACTEPQLVAPMYYRPW